MIPFLFHYCCRNGKHLEGSRKPNDALQMSQALPAFYCITCTVNCLYV